MFVFDQVNICAHKYSKILLNFYCCIFSNNVYMTLYLSFYDIKFQLNFVYLYIKPQVS